MPTVSARIDVSVNTGDLDSRIGAQVEQLQQIVRLIARLIDDPPNDVKDFLDIAGNLPVPEFNVEGDFVAGLRRARDALPLDLGNVTGAVSGSLGSFATLVAEELGPLLQDSVRVAAAIDKLTSMDFRCAHLAEGAGAGTGGGAGGQPPPAGANPGAERLANTAQQVQQVNELLDRLPATPSPGGLLEFFLPLVDHKSRNKFFQLTLPVIDDVVEPLRTLTRWRALTPAEIGAELAATIALLDTRLRAATLGQVDSLGADLGALLPQLALPALTAFADAYAQRLAELVEALEANDLAATTAPVAALDAALDGVAPTLAAWDGGVAATVETLRARIEGLTDALLDAVSHLLTLLEPVELPQLAVAAARPPRAPDPAAVAKVQEAVQPAIDRLHDLLALLDFSALQAQVGGVAERAQQLAAGIEQGLTGVTLEVQALFDGVSAELETLDLGALQETIESEIARFGDKLERELQRAFEPAADGISEIVGAMSEALDEFDPSDVVDALRSVLDAITGVLEADDVQAAVQQVRDAIANVTATLEQLSFAPVTDEVVALIEQMTAALRQVQGSDLHDAAKAALAVALEVLPDDLKPVTDPLLVEFDGMIETGPVPLLERVAQKPAELLGVITKFQPGALIGEKLGGPYREVLSKAEAFKPSSVLERADAALAAGKRALVQAAGPAQALALLDQPFGALRSGLDRFSPGALLEPLENEIEKAVQDVIVASPVDEIFAQVNRVFALLEAALGVPRNLVATLQRVNAVLQSFSDSGTQIDAWRDALLDKVLDVGDTSAIGAALTSFRDAVVASAHGALSARYDGATAGVGVALAAFAPGARLTALVGAHNRARSLANGLPSSPERIAVLAALDRFDPSRARPLRLAQELEQVLGRTRASFAGIAPDWQALVEDPDGLLAEITMVTPDVDGLRQLLATAAEPVLVPLRYAFAVLETTQPAVAAMLATLTELVDELTTGVGSLVTGPGSLQSISDAVQQVVDTLRNIDLAFLREGLERLFLAVKDQIDALDPKRLGQALNAAFTDLLDGIDLEAVIPAATVAELDASYAEVLAKLRSLNPEELITSVVQPEYDATIVPLVEAFDLTPAFTALIEFLKNLADELRGELDRVNGAYQTLRAARPSLSASINLNVSI